jgi:hypothetical protein
MILYLLQLHRLQKEIQFFTAQQQRRPICVGSDILTAKNMGITALEA